MGRAVGIDLGTTNSVVAVMEGTKPMIVPNREGDRVAPSVVAIRGNDKPLVGKVAKRQSVLNPDSTVYSAKRFMGRKFSEVMEEIDRVSYKVISGNNDAARFQIGEQVVAPEEIAAQILRQLIDDASHFLGEPITDAVITVPAYFNDAQRQATKNAGEIAGINVLRIINEPTAAALAYGLEQRNNKKVLVFDLGGGTFDVSILDIESKVCEVRATSGDTHLGGDDFDKCVMDWIHEEFQKLYELDLRKDPQAWQRVAEASERAKCDLSFTTQVSIDLPFLMTDESGPKNLNVTLTRDKLESLVWPLLDRCIDTLKHAMDDAKLSAGDIHEVLLVGGSTRMPAVRRLVKEATNGMEPNMTISPDEVVALGAAVQAAIIQGQIDDLILLDVTPFSLGVMTHGGKMEALIERNSSIPTRESKLFSTATHFQRGVDVIILQGEHRQADKNRELGRFALDGLKSRLKGEAEIDILFDIDENGILKVTARDLQTGNESNIVISGTTNLDSEEIAGMALNAAAFAKQDKYVDEQERVLKEAEYMVFRAEDVLRKLAEQDQVELTVMKDHCEKALRDMKDAVEGRAPMKKLQRLREELEKSTDDMEKFAGDLS